MFIPIVRPINRVERCTNFVVADCETEKPKTSDRKRTEGVKVSLPGANDTEKKQAQPEEGGT